MKNVTEEYRLTDSSITYAKMNKSFKWANKDGKDLKVEFTVKNGGIISIKDSLITQNKVLKRSLVGEFNAFVVLSEVRRWASSLWKQAYDLNIYEIGNGIFFFEFDLKMIVDHVMEGDWHWRKTPISLQWWNPLSGTIERKNRSDTTWIKIVGLLWTQKFFK